ncbi:MAG: SUMF1/EgtB/PvdO family nonheme iron enzyme [Pseudomonadota bacterium]
MPEESDMSGRMAVAAGLELDEYRLIRQLGAAATGRVWLAHDWLLDRPVVVRLVDGRVDDARWGSAAGSRGLAGARALARVTDPAVCRIHRVVETAECSYVVSDYARGVLLSEIALPLPAQLAQEVALALSGAVAALHAAGVVHGDIRPGRVALAQDSVELAGRDGFVQLFGIEKARVVEGSEEEEEEEEEKKKKKAKNEDVRSLLGMLSETCEAGDRKAVLGRYATLAAEVAAGRDGSRVLPAAVDLRRELLLMARRTRWGERGRGDEEAQAEPANPYRGLLAYQADDQSVFFGRSREIEEYLVRLRSTPLLVVVGESGSGKSSLLRAGVVPAVAAGALGERAIWETAIMCPGQEPCWQLAKALASIGSGLAGESRECSVDELAAEVRAQPAALGRLLRGLPKTAIVTTSGGVVLRRASAGSGGLPAAGLLLVVDQLEEVFTLAAPAERQAFLAALSSQRILRPGIRVVLSLRQDYLGRLREAGQVGEALVSSTMMLAPMSAEGLREVVEGPARARGCAFESAAMVAELVGQTGAIAGAGESASGGDGSLALLSFVLAELWEERDQERRVLPRAGLVKLGGLGGALARHGDRVLAALPGAEQQEVRRQLMALVGEEGTRIRRSQAELLGDRGEVAARALEALVRGRLVVAGETVEIAHEALVREWPRLRDWLQAASAGRQLAARVEAAARKWAQLGRGSDGLLGERRLKHVAEQGEKIGELSALARELLERSQETARRARRRRWLIRLGAPLVVVVGMLLASGVIWIVEWQHRRTLVAARLDEAQPLLAEARSLEERTQAQRQAAWKRYDGNDFSGGDQEWGETVLRGVEARLKYAEASAAVDRALAADPENRAARTLGATIAYEWLLASELGNDREAVVDISRKLTALDERGDLVAKANASGWLVLRVEPADATVTLHHVEVGPRSVADAGQPIDLEPSFAGTVTRMLAPGSYLLAIAAPGRHPIRYPLLIRRGEEEQVALVLPRIGTVPAGYQYIAAGWSLLGSAEPEPVRRAHANQPEHRVWVAAFLIAEHEVTFGEYLEYLASMPAGERERWKSNILEHDEDGVAVFNWYRKKARIGEKFCRDKRQIRRCQDWLRFPMVSVSWDDAKAYADWLRTSGRVKGARLCSGREWERAARGADGRLFPAGNKLGLDQANCDETYSHDMEQMGLDEVGSYPAGKSPFGLVDMAGNATEWVGDSIDASLTQARVTRGGSWIIEEAGVVSVNRLVFSNARDASFGMRVCASVEDRS